MVPRYDPTSRRWEATSPEETEGYDLMGTLLRQGPKPFVSRLLNAEEYEQGVLKMMAQENWSRNEAQGNMDAYIRNPNDWALQKMEEQKGISPKLDYANVGTDPKDIVLTGAWGIIITTLIGRIAYVYTFGCDEFCTVNHF